MPISAQFRIAIAVAIVISTVGCHRGTAITVPDGFPALDDARMPGRRDCPDLTGLYSTTPAPGSDLTIAAAPLAQPGAAAIEFEGSGAALRMRSWWAPEAVRNAAIHLQWDDEAAYARWWVAASGVLARPRDVLSVDLASALPGPTPVRMAGMTAECADGWMKLGTIVDTGATSGPQERAVQWIARDREGGLLVRNSVEVNAVRLPLWCGDGCGSLTLYADHEQHWARYPPSAPPAWDIGFSTLPVPAR